MGIENSFSLSMEIWADDFDHRDLLAKLDEVVNVKSSHWHRPLIETTSFEDDHKTFISGRPITLTVEGTINRWWRKG